MQLTKEILEGDRKAYLDQIRSAQSIVNYIDGVIKFLETPEPVAEPVAPEPDLPTENPDASAE